MGESSLDSEKKYWKRLEIILSGPLGSASADSSFSTLSIKNFSIRVVTSSSRLPPNVVPNTDSTVANTEPKNGSPKILCSTLSYSDSYLS